MFRVVKMIGTYIPGEGAGIRLQRPGISNPIRWRFHLRSFGERLRETEACSVMLLLNGIVDAEIAQLQPVRPLHLHRSDAACKLTACSSWQTVG